MVRHTQRIRFLLLNIRGAFDVSLQRANRGQHHRIMNNKRQYYVVYDI